MKHPEFWKWLAWTLTGVLVISFLPLSSRGKLIAIIVVGGITYLGKDGLNNLANQLQSKGS